MAASPRNGHDPYLALNTDSEATKMDDGLGNTLWKR